MLRMEIEQGIRQFAAESPLNYVSELAGMPIYDAPLVGIASAQDSLFARLKEPDAVGMQHMLPGEWLSGAKTVISYFLPFSQAVRQANRVPGPAAREWMYGRFEGEQFNNALRAHLVSMLEAGGFSALAPALDARISVVNRRSNWSERHVAFIAGLGTFSLSRSLITEHGSAGRIGSVITDLQLTADSRPYQAIDEYCSKCGACIMRCPPLAITEAGKDNTICSDYLDRVLVRFRPRYGCGKCQTGVPCEHQKPAIGKSR